MGQLKAIPTTNVKLFGYVEYDIPKSRSAVYNRLRDRLRRISLMRTWSVYLVRLEYRDQVLAILKDLDEDEDQKQRILYDFTMIDASESEKMDKWVQEEFKKSVAKIKDRLYQKLGEAELQFDDGELNVKDKALVQRGYLSKELKKVKEARRLATIFDVTGVMEAAFEAFEKLVESRRMKIKAEVEAEIEAAKEEEKAEKATEVIATATA